MRLKVEALNQVKRLIAEGTEVDERDDKGATPLIIAAYSGQQAVADFLISEGADIRAKDSKDSSAPHAAAIGGHKGVAELLLAQGVGVDMKDAEGTPSRHRSPWETRSQKRCSIRFALSINPACAASSRRSHGTR